MRQVTLGHSDLSVGVMGLGCMGMSEFYGSADESASIAVLHHALDLGVNHFDTADMYGVGHNEELLRKGLVEEGKKAIIATKFGVMRSPEGGFMGVNGTPDYVRTACEASLRRLGLETIDLYYQHRVDPNTPIEETWGVLKALVQAGKVRYLGLSEATPDEIRRAHAVHPISALQVEYSLWSRHIEEDVLPVARELGITIVAYSPLGRGFLTGKYQAPDDFEASDFRRYNPRFAGEALEKNRALLPAIESVATELGITPAQVALAWVHAQGEDIVSIPGTKKIKYLEDNLAALEVKLSAAQVQRLSGLAALVTGTRY